MYVTSDDPEFIRPIIEKHEFEVPGTVHGHPAHTIVCPLSLLFHSGHAQLPESRFTDSRSRGEDDPQIEMVFSLDG